MKSGSLFFYFVLFSILGGFFLTPSHAQNSQNSADKIVCTPETIKTPPIFVTPTGYDAKTDQDAVDRRKEKSYANYNLGTTSLNAQGAANGNPLVVPKRSIVKVSQEYQRVIEQTGKYQGDEWVPVTVISTPPENAKVQEASVAKTKEVGDVQVKRLRDPKTGAYRDVEHAKTGSNGFLKVADLERVDKQKDFIFVVKRDSELFTNLNSYFGENDVKALEPYALRLKHSENGYHVNHCCVRGTKNCSDFPIFEVLNVRDKDGNTVEVPVDTDCFYCASNVYKSLVPIEAHTLNPIRSILSHPTLGLPEEASDFKRAASITNLNFVDSRGFVQIPVTGKGERKTGPFNSIHYGSELGDADVYLKPDVACGFMQFLKAWDQNCHGRDQCQIEFGDASHALYKNPVGSPWPHKEHTDGECIDINTSRMNDNYLQPMVKMLKQLGNDTCRSNESRIIKLGCIKDPTHDTHLHICFPSNNSYSSSNFTVNRKLKESCEKGVTP